MPIVIKEIHVKSTVLKESNDQVLKAEDIVGLKKEILKDVREYLHKENLRKNEK
jgi:hypothetical protein